MLERKTAADVTIVNHAGLFVVQPETAAAPAWLEARYPAEAWQWQNGPLVIDGREYAEPIAAALVEAGSTVRRSRRSSWPDRAGRPGRRLDRSGTVVIRRQHDPVCVRMGVLTPTEFAHASPHEAEVIEAMMVRLVDKAEWVTEHRASLRDMIMFTVGIHLEEEPARD
jgi:hypothetical protein